MKKLLLLLLAMHCYSFSFSQSLKDFWGVKFGSSKDSALIKVLAIHNLSPDTKSRKDLVLYNSKTFAGEKCEYIALCFFEDKFYKGVVFLRGDNEEETFSIYNRLKNKLIQKYKTPKRDIENYKYPYEVGDGHKATALKMGKASILCQWTIMDEGNLDGYISMMLTNDLSVGLQYEDALYSEMAKRAESIKESNDL